MNPFSVEMKVNTTKWLRRRTEPFGSESVRRKNGLGLMLMLTAATTIGCDSLFL